MNAAGLTCRPLHISSVFFKRLCLSLFALACMFTHAQAQDYTVNGTVTSKDDGLPLIGVSIMVKGTTTGTQADVSGKFSLKIPKGSQTLVCSFIGYATQEIPVSSRGTMHVVMESDSKHLNEVVVSGYTVQSKKDFTGAASKVGAAQLENRPVQSFDQALSGQAPGVSIIQPSGVLNNPPIFRIRGYNSISLSSYPLIIVDGVAVFTGLAANTSSGNVVANNPLADINPDDIESIDVLKDASASAIYGSRAANGVVVITTKKGKKGATKVNYDGWVGFSRAINLPKELNAEQYVMIKNEAMVNAGQAPGYNLQKRNDGSIVDTRWSDYAYQTGVSQNHNMSFSGANDATSYFISVGYSNQNGILRKDGFTRKVGRANIDHHLTKNITVGTNFSYSNSLNISPNSGSLPGQVFSLSGIARLTYITPPDVAVYNEDGSYNLDGKASVGYGANTTKGYNAYNLAYIINNDKFTSENNNIIGNVYGEWELVKNLKLKTSYSMNKLGVENDLFFNPVHGDGAGSNGIATDAASKYYRTDWTNTLNYTLTFLQNNHLNLLGGYEEIYTTTSSFGATRTNLTDPYFTSYQGGYLTTTASNNAAGGNGFRSYFSNVFYDYKKKYLLSASFRRDGFSGLSDGNKFGNFGGGSVGWNISEEPFYQDLGISKTITDLKLHGSYGQVGNVNIGDFPSLSLYSAGLYAATPTLGYSQAGNTDLKWETSKKTDIGVNAALYGGRINIDLDYYDNNIDGLILNVKQAPSKGIPGGTIAANVGSMYNKGYEFNISAQIINDAHFKWTSSFNVSTVKNRVTALANNNTDIFGTNGIGTQNITRVGYPVGSIWTVPTLGVNPANGQRIYLNHAGKEVQYNQAGNPQWTYLDGTPSPAIDAILDGRISGSAIPSYYGGFNNTFSYKSFDLSVGITYSGGNKIYNGTKAGLHDQRYFNNSVDILNRWTHPGQITDIPRLVYGDSFSAGFSLTNSANVEDGSYAKVKNIAVGYKLPTSLVSKVGVASVRVYAQISNLYTLTKYTGSDPEISTNGDSNTGPGVDQNSVPGARTVTFGINIGF